MPDSRNAPPSDLPLLIFDGDSGFCRAIADRWREAVGRRIRLVPHQEAPRPLSKTGDRQRELQFLDTDGTVAGGAEAVRRVMAHCGRKRWLLWLFTAFPPFSLAANLLYRSIAANRRPLTVLCRIWWGRELRPPTYHLSSALFLRLLGLVYLIAFVSLWTQIDGLVGDRGILPARNFLSAVERHFSEQNPPASPLWNLPTLAWFHPHDRFLHLLCAGGSLLSVLLILGVLPMLTLIILWALYLSLFHVGQVFLSFQWDILLLESGFVAIFLAPFGLRSRFFADRHPPRLAIWLVWWLLFRLMFESGAVKLTWNDGEFDANGAAVANTWEALTALDYHYWTQPLPVWTSWYAAHFPPWFQKLSVIILFIIELGLPWFVFGPRPLRYVAFGGITLLMLLIAGTGNYNFFNLLTVVLALTLLDDRIWPRSLRRRISGTDWPLLFSPTRWRSFLLVPYAGLAIVLGAQQVREAVAPAEIRERPRAFGVNITQFHLVNDYGLFRRMTETRPEIMIEGSADGTHWQAFEFRWKPGTLSRPPRFNTPHQPRLDWQMWFEALRLEQVFGVEGTIDPGYMSPWFQSFLWQLLKGEPKVVGLLAKNPFPTAPPRFIRIVLYQYRFTNATERRDTGNWWHRKRIWGGPGWSLTN